MISAVESSTVASALFLKKPGCYSNRAPSRRSAIIPRANRYEPDTHPSPAESFSDHRLYHWRRFVSAFPHREERRPETRRAGGAAGNRSYRDSHVYERKRRGGSHQVPARRVEIPDTNP